MDPLFVVGSGCVGRQKAFVLSLLPLDPGGAGLLRLGDGRPGEPGLDRGSKRSIATETECELELGELDAVLSTELGKCIQLVELTNAVAAIAGVAALRDDEPLLLEVPQHAR
jgi:hypothetical protein